MPYCYTVNSAANNITSGYQTSATGATQIDFASLKAGAAGRASFIYAMRGNGRGSQLTALTGISLALEQWTTASTGGTAITPSPNDRTSQASKGVVLAGTAGGTAAVTSGSGGPTFRGGFGFGASGPGGWVAANPDAMYSLESGFAGSYDLFSLATPAVSFGFDWQFEFQE